jgi:hypothetical protein
MINLTYVGDGRELHGIPKRDLTDADFPAIAKLYGWHENNIPSILTGNKNSLYVWENRLEEAMSHEWITVGLPLWKRILQSIRNRLLRI